MEAHALVSSIYAAAADRVAWSVPLDGIAGALDLWGAQVVGVDKRNGGLVFSAGSTSTPPETELDYIRYYHRVNPRLAPSMALQVGQWMHCHEHFDEQFVANDPFYQEYLIPYGGRYLSGTKLIESDDFVYMLGVMRGLGQAPIGPADMPLLEALRHHLGEALQNYSVLRRARAELDMAQALLARFQYPMLLLDEGRTILSANAAARELLAQGEGISERSGILVCGSPEANNELTEAVRALGLEAARARRGVVRVPCGQGRFLNLCVSTVRPEHSMRMFGPTNSAVVVVHDPRRHPAARDPVLVAECFSLTPAEARVAVRRAEGLSVKEIARAHRTSVHTVRSQLQSVLLKTGATRQADLVRLVLAMPI